MVEMQGQATAPVAPTPPPTPAPQAPATQVSGGQTPAPIADLSAYSAAQLRRMHGELQSQRSELAQRRGTIGEQYETASGDNRAGIGERLRVLDGNIVAYEAEIARVGRELALKQGGETSSSPQSGNVPSGYVDEDEMIGGMFGTFLATALVAVFIGKRYIRRRYGRVPAQNQSGMIASNERLDRIEQAVDTIAVEIERVSENQRFMTRLMTETQLGDTIKDVRKSTELAKSAAESGK
jgi:hypothetical protein